MDDLSQLVQQLNAVGGNSSPPPATPESMPESGEFSSLISNLNAAGEKKFQYQPPEDKKMGVGEDIARDTPAALLKAREMLPMAPFVVSNLLNSGLAWSAVKANNLIADDPLSQKEQDEIIKHSQLFPWTPEEAGGRIAAKLHKTFSDNPLSDQEYEETVHKNSGLLGTYIHEPQTIPGRYYDTALQFLEGSRGLRKPPSGSPAPPTTSQQIQNAKDSLSSLAKDQAGATTATLKQAGQTLKPHAATVGAALASEAAGQATEGTDMETPARVITAMVSHKALPYVAKGVEKGVTGLNAMGFGSKTEISPGVFATKEQQRRAAQGVLDQASAPDQLIDSINRGLTVKIPPSVPIEKQVIPANPGSANGDTVVYRMSDNSGNHLGTLSGFISPDGKTFTVSALDGAKGPNNMGVRAVRQFGQQITADFPEVENIGGRRVTGARGMQGGAADISLPASGFTQKDGVLVPGSTPTLAEVTPDSGISAMQNAMMTENKTPFLERTAQQSEARARGIDAVKGEGDAQNLGKAAADMINDKEQEVSQKGAAIGGYGKAGEEITGDAIHDAQAWRKQGETSAWKFMDDYGESAADTSTVKQGADTMKTEAEKFGASPLHPSEKHLISDIEAWPEDQNNFGALKRLRTRIGDAQREVVPGSESMRRLQILKKSVDQAIENTVNGIISNEGQLVASGRMMAGETLEAKIAQQVKEFYEGRRSNVASASAGDASSGSEAVSGMGRAEGGSGQRPGNAAGNQGMPEKNAGPAFGVAQKAQYDTARGVTFKNRMLNGLEKSGAVNPDGTLNPAKYDRWFAKNSKAMNEAPEFRDQMKSWRKAQEELDKLRGQRRQKDGEIQKTTLAKIMDAEPEDVPNILGKIFKGESAQKDFSAMVNKIRGNPDAVKGMRAAVGDYILKNVAKAEIDETGGAMKGQQAYRNFVAKHNRALKTIFGGQGLQHLEAVAADIRRTQQWFERTQIKGRSNTASDASQAAKNAKLSILGRLMQEGMQHAVSAGAVIGELAGDHPFVGAMVALPTKMVNTLRTAGLDTVKKVQLEMMLNPTFGRLMLKQLAAEKIPVPVQRQIATSLMLPTAASVANQRQLQESENP